MARKQRHEDHVNHEAWAIPYGDLVTLLLAFFVVMYSMSSLNEGKYRVLSDSLRAAFRGAPRAIEPIQIGEKTSKSLRESAPDAIDPGALMALPVSPAEQMRRGPLAGRGSNDAFPGALSEEGINAALRQMADAVEQAMRPLIKDDLIRVERRRSWIEVEINTDILFPSGSATMAPDAVPVLEQIADILKPFPNPIRVEGHTDTQPISTREFPSNWELSAARAASVVHLYTRRGIEPTRMVVTGLGEYRPATENSSAEGRNRNRRVVLIILAGLDATPEYERDAMLGLPGINIPDKQKSVPVTETEAETEGDAG
ncbi:MAG: flagellar motor protein MotD [Gammaproteobacteria bacterium]